MTETSPAPETATVPGPRGAADPGRPEGTAPAREVAPGHTGSAMTRALGLAALPAIALWMMYSLAWSPAERDMGDAVRLFYVHVPVVAYLSLACVLTTVSSAMWLWRRSGGWDALAVSTAELALVLGVLTLVTGSIWGRPTWGTYWTWDPRLTTSAMLVVLIVGYLVLRWAALDSGGGSPNLVPAAVVGLLFLPNVVLVRYSVDWWRSLHQSATINTLDPKIEGDMLVAWAFGMLSCGLVFVWLLVHRFRVAHLVQQAGRHDLEAAIAARRAEAGADAASGTSSRGDG